MRPPWDLAQEGGGADGAQMGLVDCCGTEITLARACVVHSRSRLDTLLQHVASGPLPTKGLLAIEAARPGPMVVGARLQ